MKILTTFTLFAILALACLFQAPLNALVGDVGWCGNYWGGAYVWGFEPSNLNNLHDDKTDIVVSEHWVGLNNQSARSANASWKAYLEVYIGNSPGDGTVLSDSDFGSFTVAAGDLEGEGTSLSLNVQQLRPGQVGIYGTTRLDCDTDWFASEDTFPVYLTLGGHH